IDNGSDDNCSVSSLSLDVTDFTCSELGDNTVNLTVTDQSGNSASASATVTVEDVIDPIINCPSGTVIENVGDFILPDYISDNTVVVSDNCDFSVVQTPVPGTILPDGDYIISFVVTDDFGNTAECSFDLKVEDTTLSTAGYKLLDRDISLFPNPVVNILTIKNSSSLELVDVEIIDVTGKTVNRVNLKKSTQNVKVSLDGFASGMYFVKVNALNNSSITKRVIKQ
ncbi:T9SS type A sorting domain-containing protein, partial [uncultured Psychroserpens sp.]|uniref:T9SS type A sorting domain-containing protein n=1 Tax=uncultured Psychroserpens sp. TaxID=255436 RepID=UPI00262A7A22